MNIINSILSQLYSQELPIERERIFFLQKQLLNQLLYKFQDSPLYKKIQIKQDNILHYTASQLKQYLAYFPVVFYGEHIYPLHQEGSGLTALTADLDIKTSGTSDAKQGGKLIPTQWSSFKSIEQKAIMRTISCYLSEHPDSTIFARTAFSLTAPFDRVKAIGYVSGAIRESNSFISRLFLRPSQQVNAILDPQEKKEKIVQELLTEQPRLGSLHGVPAWPLGIIDELIASDRDSARKILADLQYVSIGGGKPDVFKMKFKERLLSLGLDQTLYGSNNHNASEGFLGAQVRKFSDLEFHNMSPMHLLNFFLFVPREVYYRWKDGYENLTYDEQRQRTTTMILASHLLHEVQSDQDYFMLFANERIPWIYDIKDSVTFLEQEPGQPLEYLVTGRYKMSSNTMNEHLESDHIEATLRDLIAEGYHLNIDNYIAGMEYSDAMTSGLFHIIIEGSVSGDQYRIFQERFDAILGTYNDQRAMFRNNKRITGCKVYIRPDEFIRSTLHKLNLVHEQSKITHLSDNNYSLYVKPLLSAYRA